MNVDQKLVHFRHLIHYIIFIKKADTKIKNIY